MNVLITAGGTQEPIDGVRFLSNVSTGTTGLALARTLSGHGWNVTLLHAWNLDVHGISVNTRPFRTFDDLQAALKEILENQHVDIVIQLAAVGDYHLATIEVDGKPLPADGSGKIGSGHDLTLKLRPNPKLIDSLRQWSRNPDIRIVAFKLTNDVNPDVRRSAVNELLERGVADLVVHNDLGEIRGDRHPAALYTPNGLLGMTGTKSELAAGLVRFLGEKQST